MSPSLRDSNVRQSMAAFATILVGLAARAVVDKLLAQQGGGELVAAWAQLQSLLELVLGVVTIGLGQGVTVLVAQHGAPGEREALLRLGLRWGWIISGITAGAVLLLPFSGQANFFLPAGTGSALPLFVLAVLAAWLGVAAALLSAFWLGCQRQTRVLGLTVLGLLPLVAAAFLAGRDIELGWLLAVQAAVGAALTLVVLCRRQLGDFISGRSASQAIGLVPVRSDLRRALQRYILVGIVIGVMTPLAMFVVRAEVSQAMSWHEAGLMQAIWRASEWVTACISGGLGLYFLPRLSSAFGSPSFVVVLRQAALVSLGVAFLALGLLWLNQRAVLSFLYDSSFVVADGTLLLFLLGDFVRVASWVIFFALLAARATWWVTFGEVLSLPLFALLIHAVVSELTLASAGFLWLLSYSVYLVFNLVGLAFVLRRKRPVQSKL